MRRRRKTKMMRTMMRMELMLLTGAVERRKGRRRKEGEWLVESPRAHSLTNHKIFRFVKTIEKRYHTLFDWYLKGLVMIKVMLSLCRKLLTFLRIVGVDTLETTDSLDINRIRDSWQYLLPVAGFHQEQECIPVGWVPLALYLQEGLCPWGGSVERLVSVQGLVSVRGGVSVRETLRNYYLAPNFVCGR